MRLLLALVVSSTFLADAAAPLRYLRPGKEGLVLESEVTLTPADGGLTYSSRTDRGAEKMTLSVRYDKKGQLISAEALRENASEKKSALLTLEGERGQLKRGGTTEFFKAPLRPIVTTAPDWSDIFELVRRYDAKTGGRQEFAGLWIHPTQPMLQLTFTIEHAGKDAIRVKDQPAMLDRYKIRLRSGEYLSWADANGRVVKLIPAGKPANFVVLEGYEQATKELK